MKLVIAVIHPVRLKAAREALGQIEVERFTICDSQEWILPGDFLFPRPHREHAAQIRRMVTLEIVVNDDFLERTVAAIEEVSRVVRGESTNSGAIFVLPVERAVSFFPVIAGPGAV